MGESEMGAPDPAIPASAVEALRSTVLGDIFAPGEEGYDEARRVWNAMIDRRPAPATGKAII